jgi:hypothetical protein
MTPTRQPHDKNNKTDDDLIHNNRMAVVME